jgi:hypothetical protein
MIDVFTRVEFAMICVNASHFWRDSAATVVFMRRRFAVIGRTAGEHGAWQDQRSC